MDYAPFGIIILLLVAFGFSQLTQMRMMKNRIKSEREWKRIVDDALQAVEDWKKVAQEWEDNSNAYKAINTDLMKVINGK